MVNPKYIKIPENLMIDFITACPLLNKKNCTNRVNKKDTISIRSSPIKNIVNILLSRIFPC